MRLFELTMWNPGGESSFRTDFYPWGRRSPARLNLIQFPFAYGFGELDEIWVNPTSNYKNGNLLSIYKGDYREIVTALLLPPGTETRRYRRPQ